VLESIKDLVTDANFDCSATGFSLQAMDSSHVSLVALLLRSDGFDHYRCDRTLSMGMNLANMVRGARAAGVRHPWQLWHSAARAGSPPGWRSPRGRARSGGAAICAHLPARRPLRARPRPAGALTEQDAEVRGKRRHHHHEGGRRRRHRHLHV